MSLKQGTFFLVTAWTIFLLTGGLLNIGMARILGPEQYGQFGLVFSILFWLEILIVNGLPYAVQKFVASDENQGPAILWAAFRIQILIAVGLFGVSMAMSPIIAKIFNDNTLVNLLRFAFLDILFLGLFHLITAYQNGLRRFSKQALLLIAWSVLRVVFMFLAVWLTRSLPFIFIANAVGAFTGFLIGLVLVKPWQNRMFYDSRKIIHFMTSSLIYFFMLNLFFNMDLWVVRYFLGNESSGFYVAASMMAKVPYFVFMGLSATVLPMVSLGLANKDMSHVMQTIRHATYFLTVLAIPFAVMIMVCRPGLISMIYTNLYLPASSILGILVWGMTGLAFFALFTTILNADNKPLISSIVSFAAIGINFLLCIFLVPRMGPTGGALSTTISVWLGTLVTIVIVFNRFGTILRPLSGLRILLSAAVAGWISTLLPTDGIQVLWIFPLGLIVYILLLVLTGELKPKTLGLWISKYREFNFISLFRS
ncbi:oligosaccharide flippase family protein [candidate division KSB1 bacterium]|nr:oligosaccharide flippase family protein [candidate division KSB1 bacterium]